MNKHLSIVGFGKNRDSADFYPTPPQTTEALFKREKFDGLVWECACGDGWTYYPKTIEIADNCPICGEIRGKPYGYNFSEDGESFFVNRWDNPCGHIDYYKNVLIEADKLETLASSIK